MALSDNCPYSAKELWGMTVNQLWKEREWVFIQDALRRAVDKDHELKAGGKNG